MNEREPKTIMPNRSPWMLLSLIGCALLSAFVVARLAASGQETASKAVHTPMFLAGQSATVLPNGQLLLVGGKKDSGLSGEAALFDPSTGKTQPLAAQLLRNRADHTATLLPDGRVLVLGGIGKDGAVVAEPEIFDPQSQRFALLEGAGFTARSEHAAMVLMDGSVLVAGGHSRSDKLLREAELWNPRTGQIETLGEGAAMERDGASVRRMVDGSLLYMGGRDGNGRLLDTALIFRPEQKRFDAINAVEAAQLVAAVDQAALPQLVASLPPAEASNFPPDGLIAVRFSAPVDVTTINTTSVTLFGPSGPVEVKVIPAQDGLLAFVTPRLALLPGTRYTLFLDGVTGASGQALGFEALSFVTANLTAGGGLPGDGVGSGPGAGIGAPGVTVAGKKGDASSVQGLDADDDEAFVPTEAHRGGHWRTGNALPETVRELLDRDERIRDRLRALRTRNKEFAGSARGGQTKQSTSASSGATGIVGTVLRLNDKPLADVTVSIGGRSTRTDANGVFSLTGVPAGHQELVVDGSSASRGGREYAQNVLGVDIKQGALTELTHAIYLPRIRAKDWVNLDSPTKAETVVTHPDMPGLEIRIPKGAVIRDRHGKILTRIAVVPVPLDRASHPVPDNFPIYFSIQPAGALIQGLDPRTSPGVRIIYPNYTNDPPGTLHNFWMYDARERGWFVYGHAHVSDDGHHIVPDPGVGLHEHMDAGHSLAGGNPGPNPPVLGCDGHVTPALDGDPVDCSTGLFLHQRTDVILRDVLPIMLTRTYRPGDSVVRAFGIDTNHTYEMYLHNLTPTTENNFELVLPDGGRISLPRIGGTVKHLDYVWEHSATPGRFYRARLKAPFDTVYGEVYRLTLTDGTIYEYGGHTGYLLRVIDRYGNVVQITRSGSLIQRISTGNGRYIDFTYDTSNRITQLKDLSGRTWTYTYNTAGYLDSATYPDTSIEHYTYDPTTHAMTSVTDRRGNIMVSNLYDANGRVTRQTLADGAVLNIAYTLDANGKVTQTDVTDPRGSVRRYAFNGAGYPMSITDALGTTLARTTTYERLAASNHVSAVVDALNRRTEYTYDAMGNTIQKIRLAGTAQASTETYTYEPLYNQLTGYTDPLGKTVTLAYDAGGRLTAITDPLGHASAFMLNSAGQPVSMTNANAETTTYGYDLGDLASVTDPLGRTVTQFSDLLGRVRTISDPVGRRTRYSYDLLDRQTQITDALGQTTTLAYDPLGNLLSLTDPKGGITQHTYDAKNRLAARIDPLGKQESFQYDGDNNLAQATDRKGQVRTYTYDLLNRLTNASYADGTSTVNTYDIVSRLTLTSEGGSSITQSYDTLDRLLSETTPQGSVSYGYDARGLRTSMTVAGQSTVSYGYDDARRLTQIVQGPATASFDYDASSRRTRVTLPNQVVATYTYDHASQLTAIGYTLGATTLGDITYTYDAAGNRTTVSGSLANASLSTAQGPATFDAANRLTSLNGASFVYDLNGNLLNDATHNYTWDSRNRLTGMSGASAGSFQYDAFGRRTSKTIAGTQTGYLYDGANFVQELTGATPQANLLTGLGMDEFFGRTTSAGVRYPLTDSLGSVIALTDASGNIVTSYSYSPYGETTVTGADTNSQQYTGRENDNTGIYYYRARYFSPMLGRFLTSDPIGLEGGLNTYIYGNDNPLRFTDPTGLFTYNFPPPRTQPLTPGMAQKVTCLENCLGIQLVVTGGSEPHPGARNDPHSAGAAVDFGFGANPGIQNSKKQFLCCALKCGFTFMWEEPNRYTPGSAPHFHLESPTFTNVGNELSSDSCSCKQ